MLAMPTDASAHISTPTAIMFRLPDRPKTGVSTLPISSGTSSDDGYGARPTHEDRGTYSKNAYRKNRGRPSVTGPRPRPHIRRGPSRLSA